MSLPIYVINLDRSIDRWRHIQDKFPRENLSRVAAFDGLMFTNNDGSEWRPGIQKFLCEFGIIGDPLTWVVSPCGVGAALSHRAVWKKIAGGFHDWAIVLEDDVQPTEFMGTRVFDEVLPDLIPRDADVVFIHAPMHKLMTVLDSKGRLVNGHGLLGYAISRRGARLALNVVLPIYMPVDMQWRIYGFHTSVERDFKGRYLPVRETTRVQAYGLDDPLVECSTMGEVSTIGLSEWDCNGGQ